MMRYRSIPVLLVIATLVIIQASVNGQSVYHSGITERIGEKGLFPFSVASGDPRQEQVTLWTKVLPRDLSAKVEVSWQMALDSTFTDVAAQGIAVTDSASAFSVNVLATGLVQGLTYYYRFLADGQQSPVGRTRTAPANPEHVRFAVVSCANLPAGYFNGYGLIAKRNYIDAVIHLGDYIYEYGSRKTGMVEHIPPHEIVSITDYRSRYAQYRLDPYLMEAHRLHPFIVIWDDHENANNSHRDGADNHQPDEGDWEVRKAVSKKAYFEWMPVEYPERQSIVRSFNFGGMVDLFMLDGRLHRDPPVEDYTSPLRYDSTRSKLGEEQTRWLTTGLRDSKARWKVIGNNVMFSAVDFGKFAKERRWNMDQWDGYPANRNRIFDTLETHGIRDLLVLTGDIHTAWGMELARNPHDRDVYRPGSGKGVIGAEFVVQSVSSFNLDEIRGKFVATLAASFIKARHRNPHIRYANMKDHGYMLIELSKDRASATWVYSKSLRERTLKTRKGRSLHMLHGGTRLRQGH